MTLGARAGPRPRWAVPPRRARPTSPTARPPSGGTSRRWRAWRSDGSGRADGAPAGPIGRLLSAHLGPPLIVGGVAFPWPAAWQRVMPEGGHHSYQAGELARVRRELAQVRSELERFRRLAET